MTRPRRTYAALLVLVPVLIAGCGGGGDTADTSASPKTDLPTQPGSPVSNTTATTTVPGSTTASTTGTTPTTATTAAPGTATTAAPTVGGETSYPDVDNSDLPELLTLGGSGDAFEPLVSTGVGATDTTSTSTTGTSTTGTTTSTSSSSTQTTTVSYTYGPAVFEVNGATYTKSEDKAFPNSTEGPFLVQNISKSSVTVALMAGSFEDASDGQVIKPGETWRFTNESDGKVYVLKLVKIKVKKKTTTSGASDSSSSSSGSCMYYC